MGTKKLIQGQASGPQTGAATWRLDYRAKGKGLRRTPYSSEADSAAAAAAAARLASWRARRRVPLASSRALLAARRAWPVLVTCLRAERSRLALAGCDPPSQTPWALKIERTVSLGWAPTEIQCRARSTFKVVASSGRGKMGSCRPRCSMTRPSRGERESATEMR